MEETLGMVHRPWRGLLWRGQCLKCCKMSNKVCIAKVRSFFGTRFIHTHTHTHKHTWVKEGWVGVNSTFYKYTACVIMYEQEGGRKWRIYTRLNHFLLENLWPKCGVFTYGSSNVWPCLCRVTDTGNLESSNSPPTYIHTTEYQL